MTTMLRPRETATREVKSLNGLWRFAVDDGSLPSSPWKSTLPGTTEIPVPASYNDILVPSLRKHIGKVWYQREVRVPRAWTADSRIVIRVDSATHAGVVYVNDTEVASHQGGYLPFDAEVSAKAGVKPGDVFRLTISVCNRLTNETIPPGKTSKDSLGNEKNDYFHDFFNYSGLHRSVKLVNLPSEAIDDITVKTDIDGSTGVVNYTIEAGKGDVAVEILDKGKVVGTASGAKGSIKVANAHLWQPGEGYQYTFRATLSGKDLIDEYTLPIGIRTVRIDGVQVLINNKPFYFRGYGRHEDTPVRGKGHDDAFMVHDFELMKWTGANSFRTSHYPYAEEVMDYADAHGWVVLDETPAVGLNLNITGGIFGGGKRNHTFTPEFANEKTREAHASAIRELINRDKNRPGVVAWVLMNETDSDDDGTLAYYEPLIKLARELDERPLTYAQIMLVKPENDVLASLFDFISLNRYYGWYVNHGDLASAEKDLEAELRKWADMFKCPLIMSEYGADTVQGLRSVNGDSEPWSEDYQTAYYKMNHDVFDRIPAMAGEQLWNFADFMTGPGIFRVNGNKKGVFTRDRTPKSAAFALRERWGGKGGDYHK